MIRRLPFLFLLLLAACEEVIEPTAPANQPPVAAGAIPDQRLAGPSTATTLDVSGYFNDPDGDALTYAIASSDTSVATASMGGSAATLTGGKIGGAGQITVTARDPDGAEAAINFTVTVNRFPVATEIPAQTLVAETRPLHLDVAGYFNDPDGDLLTYEAENSDTSTVMVSMVGSTATLTGGNVGGVSQVTVTARDMDGLEASASFQVTVNPNPDRAALIALYEATDGPNWRCNENWLTGCPWRNGVGYR